MVDETTPETVHDETANGDSVTVVRKRPLWQRIVKWVGVAIGGLALLLVLIVIGINTGPGRNFVASKINNFELASGMGFHVGKIDGSLYGRMVLNDVRITDTKGVFAASPRIVLDWRPFAFINNHVNVHELSSPLIRVARMPELKPTPASNDNSPLLPDLDIDVDKLAIGRLELGRDVLGQPHIAQLAGQVHIADRRAQVKANARTISAPGIAGGDRLALTLDAVPDKNKLDVDMKVAAPANGMIAGLAGLKKPLALSLDGAGSWKQWNGRLNGTLGGASLADLRIAEQDGRFQVRGIAHPGLYLEGPVERLTKPGLQIALDAAFDNRVANTRLRLRSDAMALSTNGVIDLGNSEFHNFRAEALLLTPGAIAENLRGRSVRAAVALDGKFQTPTVDYKLTAGTLGFGEMAVEQLAAEGRATVNADRILVPVHATAGRVVGLNAAAGGLLTNVKIDGDFAIDGAKILSDNLRLRSDKIDATAIVAADMAKGRYTGALKGRVNDYRVESFGIVNLQTDADVYSPPQGGFGVRGHVVMRTQKIFNDGIRNFLGGNAMARVNLDYTPEGIIRFSGLEVQAPEFRLKNGSGSYDPAGPLAVSADAYSAQYGPIQARVTGSLTQPVVQVRAARPGLGIGLANLNARVRGNNGAYAVVANGDTNYGPFKADMVVDTANRLTVDIRSARFAGMDITGRVQQTAAGPFAGNVRFVGSGINGTANLDARGQYQHAAINARANNAVIPGTAGLSVGRAIITAAATMVPGKPEIVADAQIAAFKMGDFVIKTARAKVDYRGGTGTAQLVANGSTSVPFSIAANAKLSPDLYTVALKGSGNGINFHTANPARIRVKKGGYLLEPTQIDLDKGSVRLAGNFGPGMSVKARLDSLDLSVVNAFVPGLGVGGTATGSLDFAQSGSNFPQADARLSIANFQRTSIAAVSDPVNIEFVGKLLPDGGDARALIKRGTTTVGRMVATLNPLPPGSGSWTTRLMAAPLGGGIRYNGPSDVLFSFAGLSGQTLSGPIAVAANFGGKVRSPQLQGLVRAQKLTYENQNYGTRLTNMSVDARFSNDRLELTKLHADAGDGTVDASGRVGLAADSGFPIDITAKLNKAQLARSDALGATATGEIRVRNAPGQQASITGEIRIPEARYQIIRSGSSEIPELTGVRRKSQKPDQEQDAAAGPPGLFRLDIRVRADNQLYVSGMGLESEWQADLHVTGTSADPRVSGTLEIVRGTYSFAGNRFDVTRGTVSFEGGAISNPQINIQASTETDGITATITVTGSAQNPQITFGSTPALPQDEVLSRLLFGSSVTNLSATEAIQLAASLNSLRGSGGGGFNPLGKLRSATGIDRLRVLGGDDTTGRGTSLAAGKYITNDIYVEIITDAKGFTATQLEISLSKTLSILSQTASSGGSSARLRYSKDY